MKRLLKKKAFGKTLWHGTNLERFKSIAQAGQIAPNEQNGAGPAGAHESLFDGYSFYATTKGRAKTYASWASRADNPPVVIEVDVSEDALLPDDNDAPRAKTWQESADMVDQVKVVGPVTSDYFKTIGFYDDEMELIVETSFDKWETVFKENEAKIMGKEQTNQNPNKINVNMDWDDDDDLDLELDDDEPNFGDLSLDDDDDEVLDDSDEDWDKLFKDDDDFVLDDDDDLLSDEEISKMELAKNNEKLEKILSEMNNNGLNAVKDDYNIFYGANGSVHLFHDICVGYDLISGGGEIKGYIAPNGDISYGTDWPEENLGIGYTYDGIEFDIPGKNESDFVSSIQDVENFKTNAKKVFEEMNIVVNGTDYSVDKLLSLFNQQPQNQTATVKRKRLIKKYSALTAEQYITDYPNGYEHISIGVKTINVSDIIGMTRGRHDEYDDNFKPIGQPDDRWQRIYDRAKQEGSVDFAGPISVVKDPDEDKYFIYNDGNHRLSVAKELGIPTMQAEVIELRERNDEFEEKYDELMGRIREINQQLEKLNYQQQTLYDGGLSINEADKKFDDIEKEKGPLINEADKLWSDVEKLQQGL